MDSVIHLKRALSDSAHYLQRCITEVPWHAPTTFFHHSFFAYGMDETVPVLEELATAVMLSTQKQVTGMFCNYYRNGLEYKPYHRDLYGTDIATLSLGASRDFYFKHDTTKERTHFLLECGDLFYFPQHLNKTYTHSVPMRKKCTAPRVSLVFFLATPVL